MLFWFPPFRDALHGTETPGLEQKYFSLTLRNVSLLPTSPRHADPGKEDDSGREDSEGTPETVWETQRDKEKGTNMRLPGGRKSDFCVSFYER